MIQWKQRLYAFLLRRILGPFLDASATQKLHDSIDFSLQEGKFVLKDITLNADYLTEKISIKSPGLSICAAKVDRLEITLTLRENSEGDDDSDETEDGVTQSSFAWRAMKFGTSPASTPTISLIAEIVVDGISLEVATGSHRRRHNSSIIQSQEENSSAEDTSSKGLITSYIDAALASLQLKLKVTRTKVTIKNKNTKNEGHSWVTFRLSSISYKDLDVSRDNKSLEYKTILNKSIDIKEILVETGEEQSSEVSTSETLIDNAKTTVALANGSGQIHFRVFEYDKNPKRCHVQQDVEVKLNHQLKLSIDERSLHRIKTVVDGLANASSELEVEGDTSEISRTSLAGSPLDTHELTDQEDSKILTGIMKQYKEAYHLAEHNQLKGGVLIPSNAYLDGIPLQGDDDDSSAFDLFFDANDQSFYNATSVLAESVRMQENSSDDEGGLVNTKIRFHLLRACLKVVFREARGNNLSRQEEYILLTIEDLNLSHSSSHSLSDSTLSIAHIEIEDAQLDKTRASPGCVSTGASPVFEGILDIGTLLGVGSDSSFSENEMVLFDAPCVNLNLKKAKQGSRITSIKYDTTISPIEVCLRQRTMSNLSNFADQVAALSADRETQPSGNSHSVNSDDGARQHISFECSCPSITICVPLVRHVSTGPIFERFGEIVNDSPVKGASLGILLQNTAFEWNTGATGDCGRNFDSGRFVANHMLLFVECPIGDKVVVDTKMQRADICFATGRVEVNPCIPLSVEFIKNYTESHKRQNGRKSFPLAPAISSFKARQEDDDEDIKIDRLLFSKLDDVNADSRKELRGSDPQFSMLAEVEKADYVVVLNVPEITSELTKAELETLLKMIEATTISKPSSPSVSPQKGDMKDTASQRISLAANFDKITVSLREDTATDSHSQNMDVFSCLLAIDNFKAHALKQGSSLKHIRVMAHDPCLYEVYHKWQNNFSNHVPRRDVKERCDFFEKRLGFFRSGSVSPIFFRSKLFPPISQDSPSLLFDYINLSSDTPSTLNDFILKRVHLTMYHLTHRYDVDAKWIGRLKELLPRSSEESNGSSRQSEHDSTQLQSMTKVFFSLTDINLDYTPPDYFETTSRSIVRIGDFRFSSNIMKPSVISQAYSLSLGDFSFNVCNHKYPHESENSMLCRASILWDLHTRSETNAPSLVFGTASETLLREIGFVNVLSLDMMDAIVVVRDETSFKTTKTGIAPSVMTSLTFGSLSMHACKDSFSCFATSVGELQAKLTALSDDDVKTIAQESAARIRRKVANSKSNGPDYKKASLSIDKHFGDASTQSRDNLDPSLGKSYLLDGYEWTTIDHDPLPELEIPEGDEQVAAWYNVPKDFGDGSPIIGAPQILPQHFPVHAISDPLSDGDMGASKYAGDGAFLGVRSRFVIHQLTVKLRFYDGYDWPEKMTQEQQKVAKRPNSSFVIGMLPERERLKLKEELRQRPEPSEARRAKLMGDLLDSPKDDIATFSTTPLPEERAATIEKKENLRRFSRKPHLFFQLSANGVTLRIDSFKEDKSHSLVSILALSVSDLFIAETASSPSPIKMLGEWVNEKQHARDTRFGTLMFKMVTWHPTSRLTTENEIESDDCEVTVQLLPMRIILDQRALNFIRAFFYSEEKDDEGNKSEKWHTGLHYLPPPRFLAFRVKPWKLKVDYLPQKLDIAALREGSFVELINVSPIDGMVITLSQACVEDVIGGGPVFGGLLRNWVQEICATQLHKFLANARPFEPFADVGQATTDLIVLPYEAFKNGDDIRKAMGSGIKSLAETFAFQTLTTTSRLTQYAANKMAGTVRGKRTVNVASNPLPSRPATAPKGVSDVTGHAMESLARGIQAANYKVVIVPYREYVRNGATGAASSVIRGVPVLLVAPLTGATEALSYTLLGARNALRPDIRKEEEAIRNGITGYDN